MGVLSRLLWTTALVACGANAPRPATHDDFHAIQRHEATLDQVRTAALEGSCPEPCAAAAEGCAAADAICAIAAEVTDRDADLRCRAARERCERYRAASTRCGCP